MLFSIGAGKSLAQLRAELNRPAVELYAVVAVSSVCRALPHWSPMFSPRYVQSEWTTAS